MIPYVSFLEQVLALRSDTCFCIALKAKTEALQATFSAFVGCGEMVKATLRLLRLVVRPVISICKEMTRCFLVSSV